MNDGDGWIYRCGTCGKTFLNIVLNRSHQVRVCSTDAPTAPAYGTGCVSAVGTEMVENDMSRPCTPSAPNNDYDQGDVDVPLENDGQTRDALSNSDDDDSVASDDDNEVDVISFKLRPSVMLFLDGQHRVADDIFSFYDSLTQHSEPMVPEQVHVPDAGNNMSTSIHQFLDYIRRENLTQNAVRRLYNVIIRLEDNLQQEFQVFSLHLPSVHYLLKVLKTTRIAKLYDEGWRVAFIDLNDMNRSLKLNVAVNQTGTYRCPLDLAVRELTRLGITELRPFQSTTSATSQRTFSNPIDGRSFEQYAQCILVEWGTS